MVPVFDLNRPKPEVGLRPTVKFLIAFTLTLLYVAAAIVITEGWRQDLREAMGLVAAWMIPTVLAYIPGFFVGFLLFSLPLARYKPPVLEPPFGGWEQWPPVTVLIPALNEEATIGATIRGLAETSYKGELKVLVVDNGSTDRTVERARSAASEAGVELQLISEPSPGKFSALDSGLAATDTPVVATVDADTFVHADAFSYLIARLCSRPQDQHVGACAGAVKVENATASFLTRMQSWDYRLGINGVKLMQSSYHCTLVAQGALSAYWTEDVRAAGGWPDTIAEDIALTWALLAERGLTEYEPMAVATTTVPERLRPFFRQRARWARGMVEGLVSRPPRRQPRFLARFVTDLDYLVPLLDFGLVFFWLPGFILFLFGSPLVVGWVSMLVIPFTIVILAILRRWELNRVISPLEIEFELNFRGFLGYVLIYQILASAAALWGYSQSIVRATRRW